MNRYDHVFWMLFVLLEFTIILGTIWFFHPIVVIVGFVVIVAGFAKIGDFLHLETIKNDIKDHKDTVKKMTDWLNRQYELTQGIKTLHESRFHRLDGKGTEVDEKLDKNYRELVGKIIDVENRLSLVSRAVISQNAPKKAVKSIEPVFESVWKDITHMAKNRKTISTLSRGVKNKILAVKHESLLLRSELTKKDRIIKKGEFEHFWNVLKRKGKLNFPTDIKDPKMIRFGSIIISFLARLPHVEHGVKPRALYLMDSDTHSLGSLKMHS